MDIRFKLYPYPVLAYYSDDYINSNFDVLIDPVKDSYNIKINFLAEINNKELKQFISEGKAQFVYHLECAQTGFRTVACTSRNEFVQPIPDKNLNGRLQVCPFIVATKDIPNYVNESFHEDYRGFKFNIEAGCVMAIGKQVNIDIEKDINDLANTPSVFSITKNADNTVIGMVVDMDQNKIVIKLPEKDYYNYKSIKDELAVQPILNSLIIIPALTYVLEELNHRAATERFEYDSYVWYRAIKKALLSQFNCDIESENFSALNMLETSQKIINTPLSDALHTLSNGYGSLKEEEEDDE